MALLTFAAVEADRPPVLKITHKDASMDMNSGSKFTQQHHRVDICIVGGGLAGVCAAIQAARHGATVLLMQDRPVLGGNSSSEMRMHVCGADRHNRCPNLRETGVLEELRLENLYRNPQRSYSIWDTIIYEKVLYQQGITLLLNCTCLDATMHGKSIASIRGLQLTTETYHTVEASIFIDCSGDGVLAPLTGAPFRWGREGRAEYNESIEPEKADQKTMGLTCMFQAKEYDTPQPFIPPSYAYKFENCNDLPYGEMEHSWFEMGYWWIELGGEQDAIRDSEKIRDELLKIVYGVWDHIKNRCPKHRAAAQNWAIDWVQFLPAKRESRRYVGAHLLTQNDICERGRFDDIVAYGGWPMDDHNPAGFWTTKLGASSTIFHESPSPYGIPYRSLYSAEVDNLMFAGRNASCTHAAMSSTRVMGTVASMGMAVGTAAALAIDKKCKPHGVLTHIRALQQSLLRDDCYLPFVKMQMPELTLQAHLSASQGHPDPVRDGIHRPRENDPVHHWEHGHGDVISYEWAAASTVTSAVLILDSALEKDIQFYHMHRSLVELQPTTIPACMQRNFRIEGLSQGTWSTLVQIKNNYHRRVEVPIHKSLQGVRVVFEDTWGAKQSRLFGFWMN